MQRRKEVDLARGKTSVRAPPLLPGKQAALGPVSTGCGPDKEDSTIDGDTRLSRGTYVKDMGTVTQAISGRGNTG